MSSHAMNSGRVLGKHIKPSYTMQRQGEKKPWTHFAQRMKARKWHDVGKGVGGRRDWIQAKGGQWGTLKDEQ